MKKLLLLLTLSCFAQFSFAQNKVVKGSVLDTSGYPIIGATIKIVGSNQATVTDMDGNFTIQVKGTERSVYKALCPKIG